MTNTIRAPVPNRVTVHVPLAFVRRGGRKQIFVPDGAQGPSTSQPTRVDNTLVKTLGRAFRWRKLLETGPFSTLDELATAEKINPSYVSRILRMTLLAPEIIEAILDGRQPAELTLTVLMQPFSVEWNRHTERLLPNRSKQTFGRKLSDETREWNR